MCDLHQHIRETRHVWHAIMHKCKSRSACFFTCCYQAWQYNKIQPEEQYQENPHDKTDMWWWWWENIIHTYMLLITDIRIFILLSCATTNMYSKPACWTYGTHTRYILTSTLCSHVQPTRFMHCMHITECTSLWWGRVQSCQSQTKTFILIFQAKHSTKPRFKQNIILSNACGFHLQEETH